VLTAVTHLSSNVAVVAAAAATAIKPLIAAAVLRFFLPSSEKNGGITPEWRRTALGATQVLALGFAASLAAVTPGAPRVSIAALSLLWGVWFCFITKITSPKGGGGGAAPSPMAS